VSEDLAHDAHLRAALRHAPDHALSPPARLSQAILAAAQQAHRPPRPAVAPPPPRMRPAGRGPLAWWWQRLTSPRVAGALATGLLAALGLGLWLDLATEPAIDRRDGLAKSGSATEAQRSADPIASAGEARDATPATTGAAATAAAPVRETAPATAAPAANERPVDSAGTRRPERHADARSRRGDAPVSGDDPQLRAEAAVRPRNDEPARAQSDASADGRIAAPAAAPPAAPALATVQATRAAAPVDGATTVPPAGDNELRATLAQGARKAETDGAAMAASPALALLQRARSETATGSARWTWATPGRDATAPFDDAAQAWLGGVAQSAPARWGDVTDRGDARDAIEVRWWRDGQLVATLRIEADGLRWIDATGRVRHAPLDAPALQRLRTP